MKWNFIDIMKCSEKCTRRDWSERFHHISIKHAPYVTRVHCWDLMRSLRHRYERAQFTIHFIREIKKTCSSSIVELYKHLGIFKNTREVQEALTWGSCFSALLSCSQKFPRAYITQQCTRCVFYFFNNGSGFEWSPIRYVITRMIYKIGRPQSGSPIC